MSGTARASPQRRAVAVNATARELAVLVYMMVTWGEEYVEHGMAVSGERRDDRARSSLERQARQLGHRLVKPDESPDPVKSAA